jgi:hypothetical protein
VNIYIYIFKGPLKRIQDDARNFEIGWRETGQT